MLVEREVLAVAEAGDRGSQQNLGQRAGLSAAMTNQYLREFARRGWVRVDGVTNRSMAYHLTDEGRRISLMHLVGFSAEIIRLYGAAKLEFEARLRACHEEGLSRLALFGAAETGEVVYQAARNTSVEIIAVVDNDPAKHGRPFGDLTVLAPEALEHLDCDAVLIASHGHRDAIYQELHALQARGILIKRL